MIYNIDGEKIKGCDKISEVYCSNFNMLRPLYMENGNVAILGHIRIDMKNMDAFDRAAMGLYIGKFVEQEINSSVVQLMRRVIGIEMPQYYCKRDPQCWDDEVRIGKRQIRLNKQEDPTKRESLATIPAGDAYYALKYMKDNYFDFDMYTWLSDPNFLDAWRKLFGFRNKVAHVGHVISQEELEEAFGWFETFLKYMPQISELKKELAPEGVFDACEEQSVYSYHTNGTSGEDEKPHALPLQYARVKNLEERKWDLPNEKLQELAKLTASLNWHTVIFTENGLKGMRHVDGRILVPAMYDGYAFTYDCLLTDFRTIPAMKNGKMALIFCDGLGTQATDFEYDDIGYMPWTSSVFFYRKGGSLAYGILREDGREICPCIIDSHYEPCQGGLIFKSGDYYGIYDMDERVVMPMFDNIEIYDPFEPMVFTLNGIKGYMDNDLKFIPKSEIEAIEDEDERYDRMLEMVCADYEE